MPPPSSSDTAVHASTTAHAAPSHLPRLGFLGLGWIGRRRMKALLEAAAGEVAAIADTAPNCLAEAAALVPHTATSSSLDELLAADLDGLVIATPSGLHAEQSLQAFDHNLAVFCQKPLARNADETRRVIQAARRADRLLGIDFSYRHVNAFARACELVRSGALGDVYAVDLTFHNAYGPDKGWCNDKALAGGGCLIDLGVHLVDYALLALGSPDVRHVDARLFSRGAVITDPETEIEDLALGHFTTAEGTSVRLACSWWANIGQAAIIEAVYHGTQGAIRVHNVNGSFFDFRCVCMHADKHEVLAEPPDDWEGRALVAWATQLAHSPRYDPSVASAVRVAEVLDRMYAA